MKENEFVLEGPVIFSNHKKFMSSDDESFRLSIMVNEGVDKLEAAGYGSLVKKVEKADDEKYIGNPRVNAKTFFEVPVLDMDNNPHILDRGDYIKLKINVYDYEYQGRKGKACGIVAVRFIRHEAPVYSSNSGMEGI